MRTPPVIQTHMAQKPVLRVEVGVRALRVRSVSRGGMGERRAGRMEEKMVTAVIT